MDLTVRVSTTYQCTLEQAFKTPLLSDVTKVHTGYLLMPRVTHSTDDKNWGRVGATKKIYVAKSLTQKGGFASVDKILERVENTYWKFEISAFQSWMLGFSKFTAEWHTTEVEKNKILINYIYTLQADTALLYPLNWLFAKLFWKRYMRHVLENVRKMITAHEPYLYA